MSLVRKPLFVPFILREWSKVAFSHGIPSYSSPPSVRLHVLELQRNSRPQNPESQHPRQNVFQSFREYGWIISDFRCDVRFACGFYLPRVSCAIPEHQPFCGVCAAPFTLMLRRQRCQVCGESVCAQCSSDKRYVEGTRPTHC